MRASSYLGIDLGTTNSVAVVTDGELARPVRTTDGGFLLPSVVRIDARGTVTVGARARRFLDSDPENARCEFKRLMGSPRRLAFRAAQLERTPEELSALVLQTLRTHAEQMLGHAPEGVVVTVPALFELPQIRATSEAARLAGFTRVEHLQEPVASALTAGWKHEEGAAPWLVYDLGGGTFDVSLLETREGVLRVVGHDGDNFLGGRDMDALVLDHVLAAVAERSGKTLRLGDPSLSGFLRRLKTACEDAKLELGARRDAVVSLPEPAVIDGEEIIVDVPIDVATFERLVLPIVDRSVEVCLRLLGREGVEPAAAGRVVLVGGPTVMPCLRARLQERLGIPLATDIDPMLAVAEGAAYFAREHGIGTRGPASASPASASLAGAAEPAAPSTGGEQVWLQYPGVSGDLFPYVVGRVGAGRLTHVLVERADGAFVSGREKVDEDGSFVVQVELLARAESRFRLEGVRPDGARVPLAPAEIVVRHGISLADPPLARSIGVALADGSVATYFERGAPLPSRKTFRLRSSLTVHPGQHESAITVPIVQGEAPLAHLCRLVGTIEIKPEALQTVLVAGSSIDVILEVDRGGKLTATAQLPSGPAFPGTLALVSADAPLGELSAQVDRLRAKVEGLYADALVDEDGRKRLVSIDAHLVGAAREIEASSGGDGDALEKLRRLVTDADAACAEVEALRTWPELEAKGLQSVSWAIEWVARAGTPMEQRTLEEAIRSLHRARAMRNVSDFGKRLGNVERVGEAAFMRDPEAVARTFDRAVERLGEMRDPRAAKKLVSQGEAALVANDTDGLRKASLALWALLPPLEEVRVKAHRSGVER